MSRRSAVNLTLEVEETQAGFGVRLAACTEFNALLASSVKAHEVVKNGAIHIARCLLAQFGDTISLLPKPDSEHPSNPKSYRGATEGNDLFPKFDKYELEKVERGTPKRSFYGDLMNDYLPIGQAIAEEIEMTEASDAFNPETRKAALAALNTKRTNAVSATKRAVNTAQQIKAVNAMSCVKADFSERLELGTGEYVLDGTIRVEDTSAGRVRAFELLSISEFLRLNVDTAKGLGGTYSQLLSTLKQPPKATDDKMKTYKAELKTTVESNFKEARDTVKSRGSGMPANAIQQILVDLEKKFLDILEV
jgi:hypothetical protein